MRLSSLICALVVLGIGMGTPSVLNAQQPPAQKCPEYLIAEYMGSYFYQLKNCQTGKVVDEYKRYVSIVKKGCNGTTGCNCTTPIPMPTQMEYADPEAELMVPFGKAVGTYMGVGKKFVKAGNKTFVIFGMTLKGKNTGQGQSDNELDIIFQFGMEVDPSAVTTNNTGTLTGNTLAYDGQNYSVTTMGMTSPDPSQQQQKPTP